jgi:hypothetical protein
MTEATEKQRPPQRLKTFTHCFGHAVRLTDERLAHILEHQEMNAIAAEIE